MKANPVLHHQYTPEQVAASGLLWLDKISATDAWNLSQREAALLLGDIPLRTYTKQLKDARDHAEVRLSRDARERLSLLAGIHQGISMTAPNGEETALFNRPIKMSPFNGKSVREYVLGDGSMRALYVVRRFFDAYRG